jgi:hypothetical protein
MSQLEQTDPSKLNTLYRIGGAAPLLTLVFYLSELVFIPREQYPATIEDWFALFQQSKLLGLFYLNALDIFSIALLGLMFLALYAALQHANRSWMITSVYFGLLGVCVFIVPRVAMLSLVTLSDQYSAAAENERIRLLTAGETLGAFGTATPQTIGFLFMAIAVFILSIVMLKEGHLFNKIIPWFGILASLMTVADHISVIIAPALATALMIASGLFWIPWWIMIGLGLLRLGNKLSNEGKET